MRAMAFVIGDWDNYISANNYRIHRGSTTGRWSFIPTGTDQTFQKAMNPFRGYSKGSFPILFEKCLASGRCTAGYRDAIGKAVAAFKAPAGVSPGPWGDAWISSTPRWHWTRASPTTRRSCRVHASR